MNCKFCNAELDKQTTICPDCGRDNAEEPMIVEEVLDEVTEKENPQIQESAKPKRSIWTTILATVGALALVIVLVGAVIYGLNTEKTKAQSYTVSDEKAQRHSDTVVAVAGDRELTNSELQIYYWQNINEYYNYMGYYMDVSQLGLDLTKPLDQQMYNEAENITWQQYFVDLALDSWHRYAALAALGESEGFQLTQEDESYLAGVDQELETMAVAYGYESAIDMLTKDMGAACTMDGYRRYVELNYYVGQYFNTVYERLAPSMEELEQYYAENEENLATVGIVNDGSKYANVRHILICPTGGTLDEETGMLNYSEADWETCRQQAQDILDRWQAGEATEESFALLAMEHTQDPGSQSTGGLYTDIYEGQMVEPFENWCFDDSRVFGDTGLVQTTYGYHIMYFVSAEPTWIADLTAQLVNERSTAMISETVEKFPAEIYDNKIVLAETSLTAE